MATRKHPVDTCEALRREVSAVEAHLGRVDTKAGLLLGLAGVATSAGVAVAAKLALPVVAAVLAWSAVATVAGSAVVLAVAIRPALRLPARHGFVAYAHPGTPVAAIVRRGQSPAGLTARLVDLSRLVVTKYRRIRTAVDLLLVGFLLAAAATVTAVVLR